MAVTTTATKAVAKKRNLNAVSGKWAIHKPLTKFLSVLGLNRKAYWNENEGTFRVGRKILKPAQFATGLPMIQEIMKVGKKVH